MNIIICTYIITNCRPALQYIHFYGANPHVRAGPKAAKLMNRFPNHGSSYRGNEMREGFVFSLYLSLHLSLYLSLSLSLSVSLSVCLSLFVSLSFYLSLYLFLSLSISFHKFLISCFPPLSPSSKTYHYHFHLNRECSSFSAINQAPLRP